MPTRLLACLVLSTICVASHAAEKSQILMLTQSAGYVHASVNRSPKNQPELDLAPAEVAMVQLGQKTGLFTVHCTQDATSDITKDNLQNYDIVMFYTSGKLPIADADMEYFLNTWLKQKGHGFIGFHSALDTYKDYQPYWDMVGGSFVSHPWGAGTTVTISVHEPEHPTMKPFGAEFQIRDEIYKYSHWQPEKVRVLMSLNMAKCKPSEPNHVPVAWVKSYGEGRVYVNNLGHNPSTWSDQRFLDSVTAGVKWIRGDVPGKSAPNPEVSKAQEAAAKAAVEAKTAAKPSVPPAKFTDAGHTVDGLDVVKKLVDNKAAVLLDVREQDEWDEGHLKAANLVPLSAVKSKNLTGAMKKHLPKDKPVYVHCKSGARVLIVAEILQAEGYDIRPLRAGYSKLLQEGFEKAP